MGNGGYKVWVTRGSARMIWGDFEKVSWLRLDTGRVEMRPASGEDSWFSLARGDLCGGCHTCWGGGRWKSQNRKIVPLPPYFEEPLNSKVIKKVSSLNWEVTCFSNFEIPMFYLYKHYMSISNMAVPGYGTRAQAKKFIDWKVYMMMSYLQFSLYQWDPNTALPMEEVRGLQMELCWKVDLNWSKSMRVSCQSMNFSAEPRTSSFDLFLRHFLPSIWIIKAVVFSVPDYIHSFAIPAIFFWTFLNEVTRKTRYLPGPCQLGL